MDQGAIFTSQLAGGLLPDPVLESICREQERGVLPNLPVALAAGGVLVRGLLATPEQSTDEYDERYEHMLSKALEGSSSDEDQRKAVEKHRAWFEEHGRWSIRHKQALETEERRRQALAAAQGDAEWDPVALPPELVAPWLAAAGRSTCALKSAVTSWPGTGERVALQAVRVPFGTIAAWWFDWGNADGSLYDQALSAIQEEQHGAREGRSWPGLLNSLGMLLIGLVGLAGLIALTIAGAWVASRIF